MTASFDADVDVTVEFAFGDEPFETPTWVDVTSSVRGFSVKRGRSMGPQQ